MEGWTRDYLKNTFSNPKRLASSTVGLFAVTPPFPIAYVFASLPTPSSRIFASEICCVGSNAFLHYENGKNKPPLAVVKLLEVLDRHPDLSDESEMA